MYGTDSQYMFIRKKVRSRTQRGLRNIRYGEKKIRPRIFDTNDNVATFSRSVIQKFAMR